MLSWFRPICPCDPAAKQWVEERLKWLTQEFGLHILLERPIILPTEEYFPDPWDGTPKAVRRMFRRVCGYMGVDADTLELKVFNDRTPTSQLLLDPSMGIAAGTWSEGDQPWRKGIIRLERSSFDRPMNLVGTIAHELAHQRLLGEGRYQSDRFDNELLTDLTAVFHGFGGFGIEPAGEVG